MILIEYILLCSPLIVHLIVDYKGKVRHWLNALYVTALSLLVAFFLPGYFWQGVLYALVIHFVFFDPIYNKLHGHKLFYHGSSLNPDQALTDKFWSKTKPLEEIFIRLFVLSVGISVYHYLHLIFTYGT